MLSRRRYTPDKWIIWLSRTKKALKVINPLEWLTTSHASQNTLYSKGLKGRNVGPGKRVDSQEGRKKIGK